MTDHFPTSLAPADTIAGLAKGLAVLESFDTERQRLNATMAAQRAGITRAAARRHLLTLAHLGYLESDGSYYWLAPKVLRFSGAYMATARLPRVVQPELHRMAARTGLSFSCAVRDGDFVVIVARSAVRESGDRLLAHGVHLGSRLPAHATSTGRVLLAALPDAERAAWLAGVDLQRLTAHTVSDAAALAAVLDDVRRMDYCVAVQEHELGIQALAVPLRDVRGNTLAALNVVTATNRMPPQELERQLLPLLQEAARTLRPLV
ncbi:MAG: IclR family transcriptional regulator [Comamonas sp. SCN 67-35]|uniref:IclR family transcriptional regulator domain-containing protein n=1 Tax=unclassified Comamonas TaxID=2638500 RepID=UPI00086BB9D4|nr:MULTISPECIES: IclR family transcriptional regulator C-terminal domain-containing protein [unclassified Comamonas]MBN9330661.1 helix-turn-helix domain-containing protein [Comamonas sp.]ODU39904.1 MAG: IclR family transcriptional regulator [Comamonas sp. SCN 67-35]OJW97966.1 MAG: IclR family transcriptional regulator [Burkholderiales bacterium 66-26]